MTAGATPNLADIVIRRLTEAGGIRWLAMSGGDPLFESYNREAAIAQACELAAALQVRCFVTHDDGAQLIDCSQAAVS